MNNKQLQKALSEAGLYTGAIDGLVGQRSMVAIELLLQQGKVPYDRWPRPRLIRAAKQQVMKLDGVDVGVVDGLWGPVSQYAYDVWRARKAGKPAPTIAERDEDPDEQLPLGNTTWPRQRDVERFYGAPGQNQTRLEVPYTFRLYDTRQPVPRITVHEKVADSCLRVLKRVLSHYGEEKIVELHLDRFFGSLNVRPMRGGSRLSMHAYGVAIDFDATRIQLKWNRNRAALARPEYRQWWDFWEQEGWISLGRARDFDWMHVQAARL